MSGNGGHPSSLQAATSGAPPFDPGLKASQNHLEIGRRPSTNQESKSNSQNNGFTFPTYPEGFYYPQREKNPLDDTMEDEDFEAKANETRQADFQELHGSWDDDELYLGEEEEEEIEGFSSAVKSVFPGGIANDKTREQMRTRNENPEMQEESALHRVTPNLQRQFSNTRSATRGGRGGAGARSYTNTQSPAISYNASGVIDVTGIQEKEAETLAAGGILLGNDFRRANELIQGEAKQILKILPEHEEPEVSSLKTFTYLAELHFNKPLSAKGLKMENSKEFNVPNCFGHWIKRTREFNPDLIVFPYRDEGGHNPITHEDQLPKDDSDAIEVYFHNHRVENNGILKGMVRFSITEQWVKLKDSKSPYFKWLSNNRVYLRHNSFDADTMVLLGFMLGAHPDAVRLLDLTNELTERLNLPDNINFQLSIRNLTAIHSMVTRNKFGFKAIAVETDAKMTSAVREAFFRLGDPKVEKHKWPITGTYLFIPMFKTESWTPESIAAMAKLHVKMVSNLEQIFVLNIFDLDTVITFTIPGGTETRKTLREAIQASFNNLTNETVVHSVHTTNRPGVTRILVTKENVVAAKAFFDTLQDHLRSSLSPEDMHLITQGKTIQVTDRTFESSDSKVSAGYAAALLRENPQDGEPEAQISESQSPQRKKSRMEVSYSSVARRAIDSRRRRTHEEANLADADEDPALSLVEDTWEQKFEASFQKLFGDQPPLRAEEMESRMQEVVNKQAAASEHRMDRKLAELSSEFQTTMDNAMEGNKRLLLKMFEKQNQMFLNMTDQMQGNMLKMDENIKVIAMQTSATLTHTEAPKLDVRKTSPVTRRRENGTAGASDAGT